MACSIQPAKLFALKSGETPGFYPFVNMLRCNITDGLYTGFTRDFMKFAIIGILALTILGGGGYAAYSFLNQPAVASAPMDEAAQAAHDAKMASAKEAEAAATAHFVPMDVLVLPVIDDSGIVQNISLVISLEVADAVTALEVTNMIPRLKDAYIQDMYGALSRKTILDNGVLQVAPVKDRLHRITVRVMGENKIKSVLLQVVQQKRV